MSMSPRLLRPKASGFTPKSISGLQLWLDSADGATLFDATSGGSAVAADGAVARWEDKSGNARHFTQSTANNRPTWRAASQNGLGVLEFDGTNDSLVGDSTQYAKTNAAFTAAFVHFVESTSGNFPTLMSTKTNQSQNFRWINSSAATYSDYAMGSFQNFLATNYTTAARGAWRYVLFDFIGSNATTASSYSARANKAALTQASAGGFGSESAAGSAIGSESGGSNLLKGKMAEVVIYNKVLSATERNSLENYFHNKWAL